MSIIIGTFFTGKVSKVNNQWIESKFFILGIPWAPVSSMFVINSSWGKREGFDIPLNGKSVAQAYIRIYSLLALIGMILYKQLGMSYNTSISEILIINSGIVLSGILLSYSHILKRNSDGKEKIERKKLDLAIKMNALPEWLPDPIFKNLFQKLNAELIESFGQNEDFHELVKSRDLNPNQMSQLYAYFRYLVVKDNNRKNKDALSKISKRFGNWIFSQTGDLDFSQVGANGTDDFSDDSINSKVNF